MPFSKLTLDNVQDVAEALLVGSSLTAPGFELLFRQSANGNTSNASTQAKAFANKVGKKNNLLIAVVQWQPTSGANAITISSVSDTLSSTWTQVGTTLLGTSTSGAQPALAVYTAPAAADGSDTVTATLSGAATGFISLSIYEMQGGSDTAPSVDISVTNTGNGTSVTSGSMTTTVDYDWLVHCIAANVA